jgi:2-polyprenyl-6-methoxyphenol hydroxylase-like FAD-dependent oxidoreductase
MTRPKAVIVGAGIAGLSAAWWLDQAERDSIIVERATSLRENGYIITLSGGCLATLERMGLREKLNSAACAFNENAFRDNKGRELIRVSYSDIMRDIPFLNLRRSDLVRVLADALPESASILFGQTVDEIADCEEKVKVKLSNGETITAGLLVGVDGFRSQVRQHIAKPEGSLEPLGYQMAVYDIESDIKLEPDCVSYTTPGHLDIFYCLPGQRLVALNIWRDDNPEPEAGEDRFSLLKEVCKGSHPLAQQVVKCAEEEGASLVTDSLTLVQGTHRTRLRFSLLPHFLLRPGSRHDSCRCGNTRQGY